MKKKQNSITTIKTIAEKMGYKTKYLTTGSALNRLMVTHNGKMCILNSSVFGWYPEMQRWQHQLFNSKILTQDVLRTLGYKTIPTQKVEHNKYTSLTQLHKETTNKIKKYPVIVKPENGFKGNDIKIATSKTALRSIISEHHKNNKNVLVQPILNYDEYRILLINNKVELVHIKQLHHVIGDGKTTLHSLLSKISPREKDEVFIQQQLKARGYTESTKLTKAEKFPYHLTRYSDPDDYYESKKIPKEISAWAKKLAQDISVPTIGIDVFTPKGILDTKSYIVIELNANPAFEYIRSRYNDTEKMESIIQNSLSHYFKK
jgi:D-alanine-D-alanine ligase-like ATP-grasp enzyme